MHYHLNMLKSIWKASNYILKSAIFFSDFFFILRKIAQEPRKVRGRYTYLGVYATRLKILILLQCV